MHPSRLLTYFLASTLLAVPYFAPAQNTLNTAPDALTVDIFFTGKLFGYYRVARPNLAPVATFSHELARLRRRNPGLLLGMGDNFAPEFGARLQDDCSLQSKPGQASNPPYLPDRLFKSENRLVNRAACDSVANFLEDAGYRALVPGREDFLYGAAWLRNIGILLHQDKDEPEGKHETILLGANLRIIADKPPKPKTASDDKTAPKPKIASLAQCGLFFGQYSSNGSAQLCSTKGDDLSSGNSIVPEKFRLLRELDRWIEEARDATPGANHGDPTQFTSETQIATNKANVPVNDKSKLLETAVRRQLMLRDLIQALSLSLPDCTLNGKTEPNSFQDSLMPLLRDYKYEELAATEPDWDKVANQISSFGAATYAAHCKDGEAQRRMEARWGSLPMISLTEFAAELARALYTEKTFASQICDALKNPTQPVAVPSLFESTVDMLKNARSSLLRAIAAEQLDVGFTEAVVVNAGEKKKALVVGVIGVESMQSVQDANLTLGLCPDSEPSAVCSLNELNPPAGATKFKVTVTDPVQTVEAVVRAAEERNGQPYAMTILMAQMPHTEAEELVARVGSDSVRLENAEQEISVPRLDIAISEAQQDHATSNLSVEYGSQTTDLVPVLTPRPAYDQNAQRLVNPITRATVTLAASRTVQTWRCEVADWAKPGEPAMTLLVAQLPNSNKYELAGERILRAICQGNLPRATREECELATIHALLGLLASKSKADVAMLERRDIFLGRLPSGYDGYEMCPDTDVSKDQAPLVGSKTVSECKLRVALGRVLWQADHETKIMVSGKDIAGVLQKAQNYSDNSSALTTTDIAQQYLETEGVVDPIVGSPVLSSGAFSVQSSVYCHDPDEEKKPSAGGTRAYCVNGVPLQADHAYWVVTSDHIATEQVEYGLSGQNPADYRQKHDIPPTSLVDLAVAASTDVVPSGTIEKAELDQQQAKILRVDAGKIVVGYNLQQPLGGSQTIINRFQGVSDATASSAGSANFDVEQKQRTAWEFRTISLGFQDDFEFDRQVQDNLTGKFVNGNFTKNLFSVGPFLQVGIPIRILPTYTGERWFTFHRDTKAPPRWLLVFAPSQFQTQVTGSHLNFPANSGASQVSFVAHRLYGFGERTGTRHEWDGGAWWLPGKASYFEAGGQFVQQRQVLAGLTFSGPGLPTTVCLANGAQSFANCAPSAKVLPAGTSVTGQYASTNQYGWYWDIHLQKGFLGKTYDKSTDRMTLNLDSKGDFFKDRGLNHAFSTQTWFDAPASIALAFPVLRNLAFAPTYTAYFYGNQIAEDYLLVHTFSVNLRWYLDRDSHAPFPRFPFLFKGPATADETQPAKTK